MTQPDKVDQVWGRYASKVLKSCCGLDNHLNLEQLSNHEFICAKDKMDLFARMFFLKAKGNLLGVDTPSRILRQQRICETMGLFDGELSKMHEAEVHVFSYSFFDVWDNKR